MRVGPKAPGLKGPFWTRGGPGGVHPNPPTARSDRERPGFDTCDVGPTSVGPAMWDLADLTR